jgi:hypothetical protein
LPASEKHTTAAVEERAASERERVLDVESTAEPPREISPLTPTSRAVQVP